MNPKRNAGTTTAIGSGFNPADFPLGSLESRAAARALLTSKTVLSQEAEDALTLYSGTVLLSAAMDPDYSVLEATSAYKRGSELRDMRRGPVVPAHLDDHIKRATRASLEFELAFSREPVKGDVFRFEDVKRSRSIGTKLRFRRFIDAWNRQLPDLLCPYRFDGDRLYRHLRKGACSPCNGMAASGGGWFEAIDEAPEWNWREVESCAKGGWNPELNQIPTIPAVVFGGVVDGKHTCEVETR